MESKDTLSSCSNSEEQHMQLIQDKVKESCMVSFQRLHSHLKLLLNNDLKGSRTEDGFKRAFTTLFCQDLETFTGTMFLNVDQLEKQLDNKEFQEIGSMASFKVLETQFQMFINSQIYLNDEYIVMTRNYFLEYTRLDIPEFRDTLIQNMDYVKKSIEKRALHKMEYDSRVNERLMQTTEEKVDSSKALDASLVIIESNGTESQEQDTSSRSGNDAHVDDADIRPIYNEEPMAEVQTTAEINIFATEQQHTEQPEFNNEGEVDQNAEQCHDICPLPANLTDSKITKLSNQSLESENVWQQRHFLKETSNEAKVKHDIDVIETINIELEHKVAKLLKENETLKRHYKEQFDSIKITRSKTIEYTTSLIAKNDEFKAQLQEKRFAIAALKNELRKITGNSVNTKFTKPSILRKPVLHQHRNHSVARQPTAFKSERPRFSKRRFVSQVDVNNNLTKPVTLHYFPKGRESAVAKPHCMIAPSSSRYSSNDMVHNHYLEEAKKMTQEKDRNSDPSVMPSATSQSTTSKSSCVTTQTVPTTKHSRNSRNFSNTKHFVCSTCQKCVFSANHDAYVTKFLNEVNTRAKVLSNQTTNINKPIKWKPTGRIFKTAGLRWVPTGKIFAFSITKVDSEPTHGSNVDISYIHACKQTLDLSAGLRPQRQMMSDHNSSDLAPQRQEMSVENATSGLVYQGQKALDYDNSGPVPPR
ncbi:hypothetical protein Tco_0837572, partial [Tanacetum coccineum]